MILLMEFHAVIVKLTFLLVNYVIDSLQEEKQAWASKIATWLLFNITVIVQYNHRRNGRGDGAWTGEEFVFDDDTLTWGNVTNVIVGEPTI